jgi:tetratricopeptide (TPR) repeat protein/O-antigen ligase
MAEILILGLFLLALAARNDTGLLRSPGRSFDGFVLSALALSFFYVWFSVVPYRSLLAFGELLSVTLVYALVRRVVTTGGALRLFLGAIVVSGVFYSAYGLLQYYGILSHAYWYQPNSLASRFVNSGHFATFLLFPLFIGIAMAISSRRFWAQLSISLALGVIGWAFLLTRARAEWLGFLIGLVLLLVLAGKHRVLSREALRGLALCGVAAVAVFLIGGGLKEVGERIAELWTEKKPGTYSLIYRWQLWEGSLRAIMARPGGWGLGSFSAVFPQFKVHADRFAVRHSHSELLQAGVDLGIPGLLLFIGLSIFYLRQAFLCVQNEERSFEKTVAAGFLSLWVALLLVCQTDYPLRIYSNSLLFGAVLALSAFLFGSVKDNSIQVPFRPGLPFRILASLGIVFMGTVLIRQGLAQGHFERGKDLERGFHWKEAAAEYERALRLSPFYAPYHEGRGGLLFRWSAVSLDRTQKEKFLKEARQSFEKSVRLQPYSAGNRYFLALVYEAEGDWRRAQAEFRKAMSLEPTNSFFISEYGYFAVRHSLTEEAIVAFEKYKTIPFRDENPSTICEILRVCYRLTQDYSQLKRVIPDSWAGHYCLGTLLAEKERWDLAKIEFEAGMEIAQIAFEPALYHEHVRQAVANVYLASNRVAEAVEVYERALARNPRDLDAQKRLEKLIQQFGRVSS